MYVLKPTLVETVGQLYADKIVSASNSNLYSSIVWDVGPPVDETTLLADQLYLYKKRVEEKIRKEASVQRMNTFTAILNTDDPEQIRMYEEKYEEASAYLVLNSTPTPILDAESFHTGETVSALAALVVSQYDSAKAQLKTQWGSIEGIRRTNITNVNAYTTIGQLEAYTGPTWTY